MLIQLGLKIWILANHLLPEKALGINQLDLQCRLICRKSQHAQIALQLMLHPEIYCTAMIAKLM
jgi:hypothetical protein